MTKHVFIGNQSSDWYVLHKIQWNPTKLIYYHHFPFHPQCCDNDDVDDNHHHHFDHDDHHHKSWSSSSQIIIIHLMHIVVSLARPGSSPETRTWVGRIPMWWQREFQGVQYKMFYLCKGLFTYYVPPSSAMVSMPINNVMTKRVSRSKIQNIIYYVINKLSIFQK